MELGASSGKIPNDLGEIERLNYNEVCRLELENHIEESGNRIGIAGENTENQLREPEKEPESQGQLMKARISTARKRLQGAVREII